MTNERHGHVDKKLMRKSGDVQGRVRAGSSGFGCREAVERLTFACRREHKPSPLNSVKFSRELRPGL